MMAFSPTPPTELRTHLVNLPPHEENANPLDLITKLIVLDPKHRLPAASAVRHAWFSTGVPLVLPPGHPGLDENVGSSLRHYDEWKGHRLADLIRPGVEEAFARFRSAL